MSSQDFAAIADDYAFFMSHSTEADGELAEYARDLGGFAAGRDSLRMLDFGCGAGEFTARLLERMNWPTAALRLTLIEPVERHRRQAVDRLARFSNHEIVDADQLSRRVPAPFDVVLSNHVLYYVADLDATLGRFLDCLASDGLALIAIAGWDNMLLQLWQVGFGSINQAPPYHTAEDVESSLSRLPAHVQSRKSEYQIRFSDSRENRMKILRFLFGEHLQQMSSEMLLAEFDRYVVEEQVVAATHSMHFVAKCSR